MPGRKPNTYDGEKTITVKQANSNIVSAVSGFINAYSTLKEALKKAIMPDASNKFGPLGHDSKLSSANVDIERIMGQTMTSLIGYPYNNLVNIGITSDANGVITVDSSKLTTALDTNLTGVRLLFQGTTNEQGVAKKLFT